MAQYEMNLRDYWLIIRRRRVIIAASTVLVSLFSFWFAKQEAPVYQATAAVKFEQSTSLSGLLVEVLSYSTADNIETQATLIKSYPVLEEVARRMGKLPQTTSAEAVRESKTYTAVLDTLAAKLKTQRVPSTSIIEITASSINPREARDLANTAAEAYRDYNKANRNARITEARRFIEQQLKDVEARVRRAEEEVWAFRDANRIISPGAESTVLLSLFTQVRGDLEKTRQQRIELEGAQQRFLREDTPLNDRVYIDTLNPSIQKLQATQAELMLERSNLALEVTDKHPRLQAIDDRLREVRVEMRREVAAQVVLLRNREDILNRQMADLLLKNREVPAVELGLQRLQRDAKVNDDLLTLLKTKHQEALIKESESIEEVTFIRPAPEPTASAGARLGLMLGLVLAFVQETLDTSIGTIEDVESYLEVPVLGIIPHIDPRETVQRLIERRPALAQIEPDILTSHALLITHFDPKSPVAEAYRTLRTNVQFQRLERGGKVLVVTSPTLQEGKTTTIVNLALTMAQSGQKTLLVGGNMRRPSLYRFFGIEREPGLSNILVGNVLWRDCVRTVADILMGRFEMEDIMAAPGLDNLHIIEAGPIPANPSELLSTQAMAEFLREVREEYDIVLIDTPPVLPVTDSAIVAGQADGVLLVYQAGKVGRLVLKRAKTHLESAHGKVWGVVLNDVQAEVSGYTYAQYYTHYYGEETPPEGPGTGQRVLDFVRRLGRSAESSAAATVTAAAKDGGETAPPEAPFRVEEVARAPEPQRRGSSVRLLALFAVAALLAAVLLWQFGLFGSVSRSPRDLFRQKLDTAPLPKPPPAKPAPPAGVVPAPAETPAAAAPPPPVSAMPPATAPAMPGAPGAAKEDATPPAPSRPTGKAGAPVATRWALEFGPFPTAADAERMERQLTQAGYQTVRFREQSGAAVYAVLIERVPPRDASALIAKLREQGFADIVALGTDPVSLRVGEALPLRGAVELSERLRASGHAVRVAVQPGEAVTFVIRHGSFASREEAEDKGRDLRERGLPSQVVQVR